MGGGGGGVGWGEGLGGASVNLLGALRAQGQGTRERFRDAHARRKRTTIVRFEKGGTE